MAASTITIQQLLANPQTFAMPGKLQLLARKTLAQLNAGIHHTKKNQADFEFNQYKSYTPGDDLRLVDWKTYGKTQKLFIKQAPKLHNISVQLIPDISNSMLYEEANISKINFTIYLFACLCNLVTKQGDEIFFFNHKKKLTLKEALLFLSKTKLVNSWLNNEKQYYQSINNNKKKLIVYCSDLYECNNEMMQWLKQAVLQKNEVIVFHITGINEMQFDFEKATHLRDLETGEIITLNKQIKKDAKAYFKNRKEELSKVFKRNRVNYCRVSMNESPKSALSKYLLTRTGMQNAF